MSMSKKYKSYDEELKKTLVSLYENGKKINEFFQIRSASEAECNQVQLSALKCKFTG